MRVAVVAKPLRARAREASEAVAAHCAARGWPEARVHWTSPREPGHRQATAALAEGADVVVAIGGDGTIREVAAAVAGTGGALGVVPAGTANLFTRNLHVPHRLAEAIPIALGDNGTRRVDLGFARWTDLAGRVSTSPFLVVAGAGLDAVTLERLRPVLKLRLGWIAYLEPATRLLGARPIELSMRLDGGEAVARAAWTVLVGSVGRIPLGIDLLPGSRVDDGLLHVLTVSPKGVAGWGPIAAKGALRLQRAVPGLTQESARSVVVVPLSGAPLTIQLDGDAHGGVTRLEATVRPRSLRVHAP